MQRTGGVAAAGRGGRDGGDTMPHEVVLDGLPGCAGGAGVDVVAVPADRVLPTRRVEELFLEGEPAFLERHDTHAVPAGGGLEYPVRVVGAVAGDVRLTAGAFLAPNTVGA